MNGFYITPFKDENGLSIRFNQWVALNQVFPQIALRQVTEMHNRGKSDGGTPVSTEATRPGGPHGELMQSLTVVSNDELAYIKDYAAHVEYGHRTRGGGYVAGQRYFERNVETQRPIFYRQLREIIGGV